MSKETVYTPVIGVEIHLELLTKTKMFSPAANSFHSPPNTNIHPIDLGYLGTLPRVNKQAVICGIKLAKALNMEIATTLLFDRKHYYYPDLPKSFQITQQFHPIGRNGYLFIKDAQNQEQKILIERIHLEEDTAKQVHRGNETQLDYNRCGVPLIEIVTAPVFKSATEVVNYVSLIRQIAKMLKISDAKMEEGSLRIDINISLTATEGRLGRRVEIKNLNSLANLSRAIDREIETQRATIESGRRVRQETKRYDETRGQNVFMRKKERAIDYYYYPEPNIPPILLTNEFIQQIKIEEMPWEREARFLSLGLNRIQINSLLSDNRMYKYFTAIEYPDTKRLANIFFSEIVSIVNARKISFRHLNITPKQVLEAIQLLDENKISSNQLKEIFKIIEERNISESVTEICNRFNIWQINDDTFVDELVTQVAERHRDFLIANRDNHKRIFSFLIGQIMKESQNRVNPQQVAERVNKLINKL